MTTIKVLTGAHKESQFSREKPQKRIRKEKIKGVKELLSLERMYNDEATLTH